MTDRLTDEQVARVAAVPAVVWGHAIVGSLAREVEADRALRPACPTCGGSGDVFNDPSTDPFNRYYHVPCPDCDDGRWPLDKTIALLVDTLRDAREDMEGWAAYASDYFTEKHNLAGDLAAIDAVLAMFPKEPT